MSDAGHISGKPSKSSSSILVRFFAMFISFVAATAASSDRSSHRVNDADDLRDLARFDRRRLAEEWDHVYHDARR